MALASMKRTFAVACVLAAVSILQTPWLLRAADPPAARQGADKERERAKWENKISFYGQEETDGWSLRVLDRDATEQFKIKYTELWKYVIAEKRWVKIDAGAAAVTIVPAKQKGPDAPEDSQVIADLPVKTKDVGLYYAKWIVNDAVEGATFCRVGPGLVGDAARKARENPQKPQPGMTMQIVPLSLDKAEIMTIPDPRFATGQALKGTPTTKPVARP